MNFERDILSKLRSVADHMTEDGTAVSSGALLIQTRACATIPSGECLKSLRFVTQEEEGSLIRGDDTEVQ